MNKKIFKDRAVMRKRMVLALGFIVAIFGLLIVRLSYVMIVKRDDYSSRAEEQWTSEVRIDARGGRILDRNGNELAVSANVYRVDFDLNSIRQYLKKTDKSTDDIAPLISEATGIDTKKVKDKLETKLANGSDAGSATLVRRVEKDVADKVNDLNIQGVIVSPDTKRYYPKGQFLAHVLGSTNSDGQGLTGVELQYNEYLSGVPGLRITELDRNSEALDYTISKFTPPISGKDATLTIDENLQEIADNDQLTGLRTRHYLFDSLNSSPNLDCNIVIGDIDDYKIINDTYGHLCGDYVLHSLANLMKDKIPDDIDICRWGGEEFVFLCFNTNKEELTYVIERFNNLLRQHSFIYEGNVIKITMTFGISDTMKAKHLNTMIKCADDRLYKGKRCGKDQIIVDDKK